MNDRADSAALGLGIAGAAVCAKLAALGAVPAGAGWPLVFADDLAVAAGGALVLRWLPALLARALAALAIGWLALDAVLVQALGSPLVAPMLAGFDPAMSDSAGPYLSVAVLGPALLVVTAGALLGCWGRRLALPRSRILGGLALAGLAVAVVAAPEHRAHRNGLVAFARSLAPRALPAGLAPAAAAPGPALPAAAPLAPLRGCARGRSVVLVVLESAAARFVDGPEPKPMPYLSGLAAAGLHCTAASAVYPESIEGQVALFCGLPPIPDGETGDYAPHAGQALPRRLAAAGYASGLFHAGRFRFLGMEEVLAPFGFTVRHDAGTIGGNRESSFGIDEEATVEALLRWVEEQPRERPVLACWLPVAGHHPYQSPPGGPFPRDTQLGCYRNALHYADRALRRLWEGMQRLRPAEELLLCVVGDHGQAFGEHAGNFGHSFELYEENLRVPLCFVAPGSGLRGTTAAVCDHLDVVPTLLDLLGLPDAYAGPGRSLLQEPLAGGTSCAFTDWGELLVAARQDQWKLIHEVATGRDRLFDLAADPQERRDVAAARADVAARLRALALGFARAAKAGPGR